jgi:hypothetical protein
MIAVDTFMDRNIRNLEWMGGDAREHSAKESLFFVPSITPDQAYDLIGENDDPVDTRLSVILPTGSYDKIGERSRVASYMERHRLAVTITYECPCNTTEKLQHHPDYSDLLTVHLLCRKCHAKAHSEIYRKEKAILILMIALKMIRS